MAMIFLDESGHFSDTDFISLAGYLAADADWDSLCREWKILLAKYAIPAIHMKEIMSPKGKSPAAQWPIEQKLVMIGEFIGVIRKHVHTGFGIGLKARYYREVVKMAESELRKRGVKARPFKAQLFSAARIARLILDYFSEIESDEHLSLIFDDSQQYSMQCYSFFCDLKRANPEAKRRIASIAFAEDEVFYPLQAADILAYATCNELKKDERGWSYSNIFTDLLRAPDPAFGLPYRSELWDERSAEKLIEAIVHELVHGEK